jgi:hypothetical protein
VPGSLELGGRFCVDAFVMNRACHHEDISHLIYFTNKYDKFCRPIFSAI